MNLKKFRNTEKKDKLGSLVFKDILLAEVLIWKHVQS